ncbi:hypothetical protein, partial [Alteromonas sp. CNT1-28]
MSVFVIETKSFALMLFSSSTRLNPLISVSLNFEVLWMTILAGGSSAYPLDIAYSQVSKDLMFISKELLGGKGLRPFTPSQ